GLGSVVRPWESSTGGREARADREFGPDDLALGGRADTPVGGQGRNQVEPPSRDAVGAWYGRDDSVDAGIGVADLDPRQAMLDGELERDGRRTMYDRVGHQFTGDERGHRSLVVVVILAEEPSHLGPCR